MVANKKSKWQKCECQICGSGYVVHSDWVNPPKICKFCQLKGADLLDAIDTILNTLLFDTTEIEKDKLSKLAKKCSDPAALDITLWKQVEQLLSEIGIFNGIESFHVGINISTVDNLISKFVRENLNDSSKGDILRTLYQIHDILNPSGKYRTDLINSNLAQEISCDNDLFKIVRRAIKFNGQFAKAEGKIKNQNARRDGLVIDGKRRWAG